MTINRVTQTRVQNLPLGLKIQVGILSFGVIVMIAMLYPAVNYWRYSRIASFLGIGQFSTTAAGLIYSIYQKVEEGTKVV